MTSLSYKDAGPFSAGAADAFGKAMQQANQLIDFSGWQVTTGQARNSGGLEVGSKAQTGAPQSADENSGYQQGAASVPPWLLIAGAVLVGVIMVQQFKGKK